MAGRALPAAFAGRRRQSAGKPTGRAYVPVAQVRALGLRPNWERAKSFDPMGEDTPRVGLLAVVRRMITERGLSKLHIGVAIGSDGGYPDINAWGVGGIMWRELKGTDGEVTVAQLACIDSLRAAGGDAGFWWPEDYYLGVIDRELDALTVPRPGTRPPAVTLGPDPDDPDRIRLRCGCWYGEPHTCALWGGDGRGIR